MNRREFSGDGAAGNQAGIVRVSTGVVEDEGITVVPESNELMTESYVMIDPAGGFFDNAQGHHRYSDPILKVGVEAALNQVSIDLPRFDD